MGEGGYGKVGVFLRRGQIVGEGVIYTTVRRRGGRRERGMEANALCKLMNIE